MTTKANKTSPLTQALLETANDMQGIGILGKDAYEKITMRHLGANKPEIEPLPENSPPAIRLIELQIENFESASRSEAQRVPAPDATLTSTAPIVVHTHTTIHLGNTALGGNAAHVEARSSD